MGLYNEKMRQLSKKNMTLYFPKTQSTNRRELYNNACIAYDHVVAISKKVPPS